MDHLTAAKTLYEIDQRLCALPGNRYHERAYPVQSLPDTTLPWGWTRLSYGCNHEGPFQDILPSKHQPWPVVELLTTLQKCESLAQLVEVVRERPLTRITPGHHSGCHHWNTLAPSGSQVPSVVDVLAVMEYESVSQDDAVRLLGGEP